MEIFTIRMHAMSFVYDRFYNYTENYQDAEETIPQSGQSKFGFEFITDNSGMGEWEMVAFAKYRVDIFSNLSEIPEIPKFTFFIDFKTCTESFYDIDIIIKRITSNEYEFYCRRSNLSSGGLLTPYQNILYWELAGLVHSNSCFYYDNYVRNKINNAPPYFYGKIDINGIPFYQNDILNVWKGYTHSFSTYSEPILNNDYRFRKWNIGSSEYNSTRNYRIVDGTMILADYFKVLPLTITSNFEGAQNIGNYDLTWTNASKIYSDLNYSSSNPFRAFENSDPNYDRYNLTANSYSNTYDNTTWQFSHWNDGSTNPTHTGIAVTNPGASYTAYYKGVQRSDNAASFNNCGQRKFVRTDDEDLHVVYESMGKIWYEKSTNDGVTWVLMNNGQPLNNQEASSPAIIDAFSNTIVVFQEKYPGNNLSYIKAFLFYPDETYPVDNITIENFTPPFSYKVNPVISWAYDGNMNRFIIGYNYYGEPNSWDNGIYATEGYLIPIGDGGGELYDDMELIEYSEQQLAYSENSKNLSLASTWGSTPLTFHFIWEENNNVIYSKYYYNEYNELTIDTYPINISQGDGFSVNRYPSVIDIGGIARAAWIGERNSYCEEERLNKIESACIESRVVFRGLTNSRFWNFGDDVQSTQITDNAGIPPVYYIGWGEEGNNICKFTDNSTLYNIYNFLTDGSNLTGQALQISNGSNNTEMYAMGFQTDVLPYKFKQSLSINDCYALNKSAAGNSINNGREGVVYKDSTQFYYTIGDVNVDGVIMKFKEADDSVDFSLKENVIAYLETEPIDITDNSNFYYTVQFGAVDYVKTSLSENDSIIFKV
ncbi:MAG: hypothetical protein AUK34_05940 [Ignavibacteria bacterium CG2_30_36_16]|nr:hypothetical protein [Ignavibacteria bacterium]OIP60891.1 MAG: hypothetical protein AUK34_05940 [Ignavibacteria bacterium CG2_30_36_16]PJB01845.1 MAG: hypothetical protein CO127_01705 [Ignavibacteria bacterium CG_4_9_14_3_um_filter_36_18]